MSVKVEKNKELRDQYLRIYFLHYHMGYEWWELAEEFKCTPKKVKLALKWVNKRFFQLPPEELIQGAIFAIRRRLKTNTGLWQEEIDKKEGRSIRNIVELNREIRADQEHIQKLQSIYQDPHQVDVVLTPSDVLKMIVGQDGRAKNTKPLEENKEAPKEEVPKEEISIET